MRGRLARSRAGLAGSFARFARGRARLAGGFARLAGGGAGLAGSFARLPWSRAGLAGSCTRLSRSRAGLAGSLSLFAVLGRRMAVAEAAIPSIAVTALGLGDTDQAIAIEMCRRCAAG